MRTSKQLLLAIFALLTLSVSALAADPGVAYTVPSEVSDQKAGSILFYNVYTSGASGGTTQNARISITNTNVNFAAFVHLFFVAENCTVADSYICLTANQTASFLASDLDPGVTGYIVAIATSATGCPTQFNFLIGDEYVKFSSGHAGNLGAEAFAARQPVTCVGDPSEVVIPLDGVVFDQAPRVLAVSNIASNADGNSTLLIINRVGGFLSTGAFTTGTLFGLLYDDAESAYSFQLTGGCQVRGVLGNSFPRLLGTFNGVIGQGRTGWMKIYNQNGFALLGAVLTTNSTAGSASAFSGGRNMHKLTLAAFGNINGFAVPVFPPSC